MALKALPVLVIYKGHFTVRTLKHISAVSAHECSGVAATVQEDDGLFSPVHCLFQKMEQCVTEKRRLHQSLRLFHIYNAYFRQRSFKDPLIHRNKGNTIRFCRVIGIH